MSACSERSGSLASGTVSFGGPTTAMNSRDAASAHDYPSLTISDDLSVDFSHEFEGVASYGKPTKTHMTKLIIYFLFLCLSCFLLKYLMPFPLHIAY